MVLQGPEGLTCPITHDAQGAGASLGQYPRGVPTKSGNAGFSARRATAHVESQCLRRVAGSPSGDTCIRKPDNFGNGGIPKVLASLDVGTGGAP